MTMGQEEWEEDPNEIQGEVWKEISETDQIHVIAQIYATHVTDQIQETEVSTVQTHVTHIHATGLIPVVIHVICLHENGQIRAATHVTCHVIG